MLHGEGQSPGRNEMNTIHQMQMENAGLRAEVAALRQTMGSLQAHMASHKFHCGDPLDGYIFVGDVVHVLREGANEATRAREAGEAAFFNGLKRGLNLLKEISDGDRCGSLAAA